MAGVRIRPVNELDIESICRIDERITGKYRPDVWEDRVVYFIRRDPDSSQVAEVDGKVVGFMLGEVRGGEFGMEEPTGWLEFFGVDPSARERGIGRGLTDALLAGFKKRGAHVARTMVRTQDADIARFVAAMGFTPAPVSALEKRLA
jgi:ribosomal protein S18 acetylase RimI-like enzyme